MDIVSASAILSDLEVGGRGETVRDEARHAGNAGIVCVGATTSIYSRLKTVGVVRRRLFIRNFSQSHSLYPLNALFFRDFDTGHRHVIINI